MFVKIFVYAEDLDSIKTKTKDRAVSHLLFALTIKICLNTYQKENLKISWTCRVGIPTKFSD